MTDLVTGVPGEAIRSAGVRPSAVGVQAVEERVMAVPPAAVNPAGVGHMRVPGGETGVLVL
ncbi:hypothetical protein STRTUCAR8_09676, partial [Streptomyces turgidiscabies Car8]